MSGDGTGIFLLLSEFSWEVSYFWVFSIIAIGVLLLMSASISGSEVAFFSIKADDLERYRNMDNASARAVIKLMRNPHRLLASILVLNNMANLGVVSISTLLMWDMAATRQPAQIIVGGVTLATTIVITFFGEIVPKVYASRHYFALSQRLALVWVFLEKIVSPITWPMLRMGQFIEKHIQKKGYSATVEEISHALEITTKSGSTTDEEKNVLQGIVTFGTLTVRQVMRSRLDICAIDRETPFNQVLQKVNQFGFSRIPIYVESIDQIDGILYIKDLLRHLNESDNFSWQRLIRPIYFVPETKKLDAMLDDFQSKHVHMAIVVDEYGGTIGLITLEDLLEEIIGDINDEFDEVSDNYQKIDDANFVFEGKTSIHDVCKVFRTPLDYFDQIKRENESLGGLILELNHALPVEGSAITYKQFIFTVVAVDARRILKVKVTRTADHA